MTADRDRTPAAPRSACDPLRLSSIRFDQITQRPCGHVDTVCERKAGGSPGECLTSRLVVAAERSPSRGCSRLRAARRPRRPIPRSGGYACFDRARWVPQRKRRRTQSIATSVEPPFTTMRRAQRISSVNSYCGSAPMGRKFASAGVGARTDGSHEHRHDAARRELARRRQKLRHGAGCARVSGSAARHHQYVAACAQARRRQNRLLASRRRARKNNVEIAHDGTSQHIELEPLEHSANCPR